MEKENQYEAADLTPELVEELKSFEDKLGNKADKEVIVIAYEKENQ